jgi:riboflavin kinase/FMN adenylyltransferase
MQPLATFQGNVIHGHHRGRDLGFPTANILLTQALPEGIYAAEVVVEGKTYHAATFIGSAKTFSETDYKAESYLLDFNQDLYDKVITVYLYKKIRDNKKFASVEELVSQMQEDISTVRTFFSGLG